MAQDPERDEEQQSGSDELLTTHALDMVTLWSSEGTNSEMEAEMIRGVMESNGIPAMIVGAAQYPVLGFEVRVPRGRLKEAEEMLDEAEESGPEGAVEGEANSEK